MYVVAQQILRSTLRYARSEDVELEGAAPVILLPEFFPFAAARAPSAERRREAGAGGSQAETHSTHRGGP